MKSFTWTSKAKQSKQTSKQANPVGTNKLANPPILGTLERLTVPKRDVYSTSTCNKSLKEVKDKAMGSHCR
jgi:hypothetical protein